MADDIERGRKGAESTTDENGSSKVSVGVGQEQLAQVIAPHDSYEGYHRFDATATWTPDEERRVVLKTDFLLLGWLCLMVSIDFRCRGIWLTV